MRTVDEINGLEPQISQLSDDALRGKTDEFKALLEKGEDIDNLLPEAFAVVREASKRVLGKRHYDVQLIGGMVLHEGQICGDENRGRENARRNTPGLFECLAWQRRACCYGQ